MDPRTPESFDAAVTAAECGVIAQRYRLDGMLGEGAMGTVYRAIDMLTNTPVAVKILHPHLAKDKRLLSRFEREIDAGRRVAHPNLVSVLDDGTTETFGRFLVMPLLSGSDLRHGMSGGIGLRRTIALVDQLLAALEHVHGLGLVHRDVKPENIRLIQDAGDREHLLLLDFGLVRRIGDKIGEKHLTEYGRVFGTPWYMAPEQALGQHIDHRVDLYAVGAVMYEMLAGAPPFDGTLPSVLRQQVDSPPPPLPSWVPPAIASFIEVLLAKDPNARPSSAAAAAAMLRTAAASLSARPTMIDAFTLGDLESPAAAPVSMLRSSRRQGRVLAGVFAIAAAIVGVVALQGIGDSTAAVPTDVIASAEPHTTIEPVTVVSPPPVIVTTPVVVPPPIVALAPTVEPAAPAPAQPSSPIEPPRTSGAEPSPTPVVHKPTRPRAKPVSPPQADPVKHLRPTKPPRDSKARVVTKLPGASTSNTRTSRDEDGRIILRPRST